MQVDEEEFEEFPAQATVLGAGDGSACKAERCDFLYSYLWQTCQARC